MIRHLRQNATRRAFGYGRPHLKRASKGKEAKRARRKKRKEKKHVLKPKSLTTKLAPKETQSRPVHQQLTKLTELFGMDPRIAFHLSEMTGKILEDERTKVKKVARLIQSDFFHDAPDDIPPAYEDLMMQSSDRTKSAIERAKIHFRLSLGPDFSLESLLKELRLKFPKDVLLKAVDLGGDEETACFFDEVDGYEGWFINPVSRIAVLNNHQRFYGDTSEVPNDRFHFLMSQHSLEYIDFSEAMREIYRILVPGGMALLEYQHGMTQKALEVMRRLPFGAAIKIGFTGLRTKYPKFNDQIKSRIMPLADFIQLVEELKREASSHQEAYTYLEITTKSSIIIEKPL